eukprot:TRINITY_DN12408_c0_g1_i2.p1 TRINITY_DN12408_c0_g1~~TRINITY_DN12408_c0_g1_i2.p1  ORF type:complete len:231 (+),score=45.08 TRINITY_DN12408_c0_g1_i2:64-756(+)
MCIRDSNRDLLEMDSTLKQLDVEVNNVKQNLKSQYSNEVKGLRKDYDKAKRTFKNLEETFNTHKMKKALIGGERSIEMSANGDPKEKLLEKGSPITRQNQKLEEAKRVAYETDQISVDIQKELGRQTGVLKTAITNVRKTDSELSMSHGLIKSMQARITKNKLTLYAVLFILLIGVFIIFYSRFFQARKNEPHTDSYNVRGEQSVDWFVKLDRIYIFIYRLPEISVHISL